jgi:hypothetical protein
MGRPQDNRLQRSGNTPLDPDHIETEVQTQPHAPRDEPGGGPVPEDNQPGHHPAHDQDKPDLEQFAEKLGVEVRPRRRGAGRGSRRRREATTAAMTRTSPTAASRAPMANGTTPTTAQRARARSVAASAIGLAEPVAHLVAGRRQPRPPRRRRWLHLAERVERLEAEVAELDWSVDRPLTAGWRRPPFMTCGLLLHRSMIERWRGRPGSRGPPSLVSSLAVFAVFLDTSVLFVAFPSITASFPDVAPAELSWILNGYTIVFAALLDPRRSHR